MLRSEHDTQARHHHMMQMIHLLSAMSDSWLLRLWKVVRQKTSPDRTSNALEPDRVSQDVRRDSIVVAKRGTGRG